MLEIISFLGLNFIIGFYLILTLQWYSYKFSRILFHFAKPLWHIYFIVFPYLSFLVSLYFNEYMFFLLTFLFLIIYGSYLYKKLDKKLIFTARVKRFFVCLFLFSLLFLLENYFLGLEALACAFLCSFLVEKLNQLYFIKKAKNKILKNTDLKIILITASFGKTSIKNFLYEILKDQYKCHKTPRSVNTLLGIVKDINENLDISTQIYIVEAGARKRNDILEITQFLNPQFCIIGEIGLAHLEYFKTQENIRQTKLEALKSNRLEKYFLHSSTLYKDEFYDNFLSDIEANLDGLKFKMNFNGESYTFHTSLLGAFNAYNLSACISMAYFLKIDIKHLIKSVSNLKAVEHRLQIISRKPKFIIDDGFNGNFKGMSQSYELCKSYQGRRVLVTPGIVEVNHDENIKLCKIINECFDFVIITSEINSAILKKHIVLENIVLKNKNQLIKILAESTKDNDLILFSNDAPNFM
ncbi:Mur ligase family protein [Campylobacter insulaenigrae]|uniref:UDP-N-acetylmuramoyl-tripeptide--D-alanyl-D-alanine ligase n=1 Tax=Campylobacter insulaenigrae TaxID=260714 RepID=A0ABY3G2P6_9BACT|nr:UDP-N-acetylmuramoyl-tripeptide--D-alanyl-D-alanine ligase [Campylobacter insulaenigrae]TWO24011.1 UDP-N-acetylmuramoyl-tripeptide--D-alanyl-D-alanine ligase [Campylobacter insulaenigrae]